MRVSRETQQERSTGGAETGTRQLVLVLSSGTKSAHPGHLVFPLFVAGRVLRELINCVSRETPHPSGRLSPASENPSLPWSLAGLRWVGALSKLGRVASPSNGHRPTITVVEDRLKDSTCAERSSSGRPSEDRDPTFASGRQGVAVPPESRVGPRGDQVFPRGPFRCGGPRPQLSTVQYVGPQLLPGVFAEGRA